MCDSTHGRACHFRRPGAATRGLRRRSTLCCNSTAFWFTARLSTIDTLISVPVRELWPNEANDFTPWLHHNPEILGDVLGTELFPQDREVAVGRYSADLLFRDSSDRVVVVENMFGPPTTTTSAS